MNSCDSSEDPERPKKTLSVAIPRPLDGLFTYKIPDHLEGLIQVGGYVKVPFGFGKSSVIAFVVEVPKSRTELPEELRSIALKEIDEVIDAAEIPLIPLDVLNLCKWAHEYYLVPLGEVLSCASPLLNKNSRKLKSKPKKPKLTSQSVASHSLTADQSSVVERFDQFRLETAGAAKKVAVLHGVTGSGKTEVYIELARRALVEGKGVLVLVPEIALTPQLHRRFEESLGFTVGLWHSALSPGKRRDLNFSLINGEIRVVVGARSAVFAPIRDLGLIVVDEEHDATYKQEDRARYHARDLAIVRGKMNGAFVVLGSATPSLETLERVREGRYAVAYMRERISKSGLPQIQSIDLRTEEKVSQTQAPLARVTLDQIQATLDAGEQVIVYLNRRGFAAFLICKDCGMVKECQQCSISLTVHKYHSELRCHHCGHGESIPLQCEKCSGVNLQPMGAGTESLETELPRFLRGARIIRLDRDLITSTKRLNEVLQQFRKGDANLLLGTQMLVKGHDFPNVTLVVVVLADSLFRWPDFRAPERALQVLKQVAGRSGRGQKPGRVLVQTYDPDHPVIQVLEGRVKEEDFLTSEREMRKALNYPPFGRLARLRLEGATQTDVILSAQDLASKLRSWSGTGSQTGLEILGPSEAFLEKVRGVFRWDILLKGRDIQVLLATLRYAKYCCREGKRRLQIDVDPYGV